MQGGLHEIITREVEIECLPDEIPEHFTVDVTELMIGQSMRASDIPLTGSMKLVSPPDAVISHVVALRAEEVAPAEAEAAVAAAAAEPEVIKKGKKEEAGARQEGREGQEEVSSDAPCAVADCRSGQSGPEYERTPHNLGFLVIDRLAERNGIRVNRQGFEGAGGSGRHRRAAGDAGQAADVHESERASVKALMEKHSIETRTI